MHFLFPREVFLLTCEALKKTEDERREFKERFIPEEVKHRALVRRREREAKPRDRLRAMEGKIVLINRRLGDIRGGRTGTRGDNIMRREDLLWYPANVYTWFVWLKSVSDIEKLLLPYRTAKFTQAWKDVLAEGEAVKTITNLDDSLTLVKAWEYGSQKYMEFMRARFVRDLKQFLHRYQEGALVMLALADCAGKGGWRFGQEQDISLTGFPGIEGQDPVGVWCLIERLRMLLQKALGGRRFSSLFSKYFNEYPEYSYEELDNKLDWAGFQTSISSYRIYDDIKYRKDVEALEALVSERWGWFVSRYRAAGEWWKKIDTPVRYYLLCRAADQISFGERYASLPRTTCAPYEEVVSALVSLSIETKRGIEEAEEKEAAEGERQRIEKECAEKVGKISYSPPELLEPRVLGADERQAVKNACMKEIMDGPQVVSKVAGTIDAFAKFCVLLSKPENHIKVKTGQYVERQVNTRSEADMVNEKARELVELPIFMAYARVPQEWGGEQNVFKGKIRTLQLPLMSVEAAGVALERNRRAVDENSRRYLKPRDQIRAEIEKRQERWLRKSFDGDQAARGDEKRRIQVDEGGFPGPDLDKEPPPGTRYKSGR